MPKFDISINGDEIISIGPQPDTLEVVVVMIEIRALSAGLDMRINASSSAIVKGEEQVFRKWIDAPLIEGDRLSIEVKGGHEISNPFQLDRDPMESSEALEYEYYLRLKERFKGK